MKYLLLVAVFVLILALPVFAQFRVDMGFDVPIYAWAISGSGIVADIGQVFTRYTFPFPEASVCYQFKLGPVKLAPGIRFFTVIILSAFWPNVLLEYQLGPVFFDAQIGGLLFGVFGLATAFDFGQVLIPDLSVWFGFGKERRFRVGGGAIALWIPEGMVVLPYLGAKVALTL